MLGEAEWDIERRQLFDLSPAASLLIHSFVMKHTALRWIVLGSMSAAIVAGVGLQSRAQQSTSASTRPASTQQASPDAVLDRLLGPSDTGAKPIAPQPRPSSSNNQPRLSPDAAPSAPAVTAGVGSGTTATVQREGTFVVDRMGRLSKSGDGRNWEFTFESDGVTMSDPPVVLIPNLKLMAMEDAVAAANLDLRFRVTGMLTEYRGRNHLMLEKVVVVQGR
jgi:hypothetical protein